MEIKRLGLGGGGPREGGGGGEEGGGLNKGGCVFLSSPLRCSPIWGLSS